MNPWKLGLAALVLLVGCGEQRSLDRKSAVDTKQPGIAFDQPEQAWTIRYVDAPPARIDFAYSPKPAVKKKSVSVSKWSALSSFDLPCNKGFGWSDEGGTRIDGNGCAHHVDPTTGNDLPTVPEEGPSQFTKYNVFAGTFPTDEQFNAPHYEHSSLMIVGDKELDYRQWDKAGKHYTIDASPDAFDCAADFEDTPDHQHSQLVIR